MRSSLSAYELELECEKEPAYSVIVHKLSKHETHDFHRYTRTSMFEHLISSAYYSSLSEVRAAYLQQCQRGDVDRFTAITCQLMAHSATTVHLGDSLVG